MKRLTVGIGQAAGECELECGVILALALAVLLEYASLGGAPASCVHARACRCEPSAAAVQAHGGSSRDLRGGPPQAPGEPPSPLGATGPPGIQQTSTPGGPGGPQAAGPGAGGLALQGMAVANGAGCAAGSPGNGPAAGGGALMASGAAAGGAAGAAAGGPGAAAGMAAPPAGPSARVAARLRVRMLPYLTARISTDFSFSKCNFRIRKVCDLAWARCQCLSLIDRHYGSSAADVVEHLHRGSSQACPRAFQGRDGLQAPLLPARTSHVARAPVAPSRAHAPRHSPANPARSPSCRLPSRPAPPGTNRVQVKLSAARVVVHRELGVAGSYTLEASLAGGSAAAAHFGARDYLCMGANLCR